MQLSKVYLHINFNEALSSPVNGEYAARGVLNRLFQFHKQSRLRHMPKNLSLSLRVNKIFSYYIPLKNLCIYIYMFRCIYIYNCVCFSRGVHNSYYYIESSSRKKRRSVVLLQCRSHYLHEFTSPCYLPVNLNFKRRGKIQSILLFILEYMAIYIYIAQLAHSIGALMDVRSQPHI